METKDRLGEVIAPFYCTLALMLCQQAREMLYDTAKYSDASQICRLISTLCSKNKCSQCWEESNLCAKVSESCISPEKLAEAKVICEKARRLCPRSYTVKAS